jgi:hypothetical protein
LALNFLSIAQKKLHNPASLWECFWNRQKMVKAEYAVLPPWPAYLFTPKLSGIELSDEVNNYTDIFTLYISCIMLYYVIFSKPAIVHWIVYNHLYSIHHSQAFW